MNFKPDHARSILMSGNQSLIHLKLPVAIVGLGISGRAVHRLLTVSNVQADQVLTFDSKDSTAQFSDPALLLQKKPQTLIVSPGVPLSLPWIQTFKASGGEITSELTLASKFLTTEKVIGITGSVGKSTCTSLLGAGLAQFSKTFFIGGNLGQPLADYVVEKQKGRPKADWIVLELSSYQLENYENLRCDGAILTYLTPNHLERYATLEDYYKTKWLLIGRTSGPVVLNKNGGELEAFAGNRKGGLFWTSSQDPEWKEAHFETASLVGTHNYDNLSLVMKLAKLLAWPASAKVGFFKFQGLPHRLENLGIKNGVRWINDSKATTIESVLQAVKSTAVLTKKTTHLLLGGRDKSLPWESLNSLRSEQKKFYFFGEIAAAAKARSNLQGDVFPNLKEALDSVLKNVREGDLVLFSPGGTSLDEFRSFEERGDFFKTQISKH